MMRLLTLLAFFIGLTNSSKAQSELQVNALTKAKTMIAAYNNKDYVTFADFLTPEQYPFEDKTMLYNTWKRVMENETRNISNLELKRFGIFDSTQQAYFTIKFGDNNSSFLGISPDNGENWFFTQFIGTFNFEQIKKMMMNQLDPSFADLDPKYQTRISYKIGEQIAPFEYEDIDGNLLKSESLKGKAIVLNFWSTGCAPCIKEMPQLNELVEKMKDKDVVFIALASNDNKQSLKNDFLPKHKFLYQVVTINGNDYSVTALPTHIIIDREQKVIGEYIGASDENLMKLASLLNGL